MPLQRRKTRVAWLSVISNSLLVLGKLVVGILIGSVSVISEAVHSGVDLLAAGIALFAVRTSGKPPDDEHPYGHGKVENLSGTIEAVLIFVAAGWIIYEAIRRLIEPRGIEAVAWGVGVMLVSAAMNLLVSHMLFKVGKEADSVALQADAWHLRTDVYTSAGVLLGLATIWVGERLAPHINLHWVDPVAAIAVALLIMRAAYQLTVQAARDLLDVRLPASEEAWIRHEIASLAPTVRGFHKLRTRKSGPSRFVDIHVLFDPQMPVAQAHAISDVITNKLQRGLRGASVTVHMEPCEEECEGACLDGCLVEPDPAAEGSAGADEQSAGIGS